MMAHTLHGIYPPPALGQAILGLGYVVGVMVMHMVRLSSGLSPWSAYCWLKSSIMAGIRVRFCFGVGARVRVRSSFVEK